jgi:uncharacterized protein YbbC (DUF1343 family)
VQALVGSRSDVRKALIGIAMIALLPAKQPLILAGAEVLAESNFDVFAGQRVGLITNQTGLARGEPLADLLRRTTNAKLKAIFAPEHGFRGRAEAGAAVGDSADMKTGIPVFSLYGSSKKPTASMLRDIDVLVFDIQDIGTRFYTYISTMGLAMQAAAAAGIPFVILDRPNPLGGEYVAGFIVEPGLQSFVGQYPVPIVHGMTVGELARMIKGEAWLSGLDQLDLSVARMLGWSRPMRWPQMQRRWIPTSPNIPTFESALLYPGMGIVGEAEVSEGRGTPTPFSLFGAPWLDAEPVINRLNALGLPGVKFQSATFKPRSIPGVAKNPRFIGKTLSGVRIVVIDATRVEPLEVGIHILSTLMTEARSNDVTHLIANSNMFHAITGTTRLYQLLTSSNDGGQIILAWQAEAEQFKRARERYLLY